ncbi:uncharacterized protein LOC119583317 [Penaeus monodon]|uniref:uncharacterized protein LOC119583317 n=1 Tax=Penaeus monodon TaxID=6687 RepID=UPI0018A74BCF|nr:uncharacterized protein LOC119583317 [Penaeus monodon]
MEQPPTTSQSAEQLLMMQLPHGTDRILSETSSVTIAGDLGTWPDNVPFRLASKKLPVQLAELQKGAITSTYTQTETITPQIAMLSSPRLSGRPLVGLNINGKTTLCFLDTGSEATLIKPSAIAMITSCQKLQHKPSNKILRGVTGQPLHVSAEVTLHFHMADDSTIVHQASVVDVSFPGDILIGMDLLRRLDITFSSEASTGNATIILQGHTFSVVYTDAESLKICCIKPLSPTEVASEDAPESNQVSPAVAAVHLVHRANIAAHSGCFVEGSLSRSGPTDGDVLVIPTMPKGLLLPHAVTKVKDRRCSVWVVNTMPKQMVLHNGTRLGTAEQVEAIYSNDPSQHLPEMPEEVVARPNYCPVESDSLEDGDNIDFGWEEDGFDRQYGVEDFGYNDHELEVEHAQLPPSIAIATCEAAELLEHDACQNDHPMPDLGHLEEPQRHKLTELLCRYKGLFDGGEEAVGLVHGIKHQIDAGEAKPVCNRQWRLPHSTRQVIREQCDSMLRTGVIEESTSPWMSPVVLVKKKGGDARAAYWSVEMEESDRPKTAFSDGYRLFQFCRLPFGLSTAPTTFQRTMNVLLSLAGLKLNMEKCQFAATTVDFLGFTISPDGVSPNRDKVLAISNTPPPRTVREVRRFLGATGFFRKHVHGYATLASPLHLLLKKDQAWTWGPEQQTAFETLKDKLISAPVLRQPDFSKEFELHTDASSIALGASHAKDDDHTPHAVAYFSRKLRDAETRYPAIDLEALAVVEGVRTFDSYLYGRRFTVYTDHRPLVYVFSRKTKS